MEYSHDGTTLRLVLGTLLPVHHRSMNAAVIAFSRTDSPWESDNGVRSTLLSLGNHAQVALSVGLVTVM